MNGIEAALEGAHRDSWAALLARLVRDFGRPDLVEDALSEAFARAAERWRDGLPDNPPAWLLATARHLVIDELRREAVRRAKAPVLLTAASSPDPAEARFPGADRDDRLALLVMAAHPGLPAAVRPAVALRFVLDIDTGRIADLFRVPRATMAARLTRAKKVLAGDPDAWQLPEPGDWPSRAQAIAETLYLAFTAGTLPGRDPQERRRLSSDALALTQVAHELLGDETVITAVWCLQTLHHARRDARLTATGELIPLAEQDRTRWHREEIAAALSALTALSPTTGLTERFRLEAVIAALHAVAPTASDTDWTGIADAYAALDALTGSPVVRLHRAAALVEAGRRTDARALLESLPTAVQSDYRVQVILAEIAHRAGDAASSRRHLESALATCPPGPERSMLRRRASARADRS